MFTTVLSPRLVFHVLAPILSIYLDLFLKQGIIVAVLYIKCFILKVSGYCFIELESTSLAREALSCWAWKDQSFQFSFLMAVGTAFVGTVGKGDHLVGNSGV